MKERFAKFIEAPNPESIAIISSVSYGVAIVAKNIPFEKGDEIILLEEQFPSNFYTWKQLKKEKGVVLKTISAPPLELGRGKKWNEQLLEAITPKTKVVSIPNVHWTDGTLFNLMAICQRTNDVSAYLIIDGTQKCGCVAVFCG